MSAGVFFFDKLCVHQVDPELKADGIAAFAAFIHASKKLVTLWSPSYFTRLWCVLEVAALVHTAERETRSGPLILPLAFQPLALSRATLNSFAMMCLLVGFTIVGHLYQMQYELLSFVVCMVTIPMHVHYLRAYFRDRQEIATQLASFSIEAAECFLQSDQDIVHATVKEWFGSLESLNEHVRTSVRSRILTSIGPVASIPSAKLIFVSLPFGLHEMDGLAAHNGRLSLRHLKYAAFWISLVPFNFVLCMHVAKFFAPKRPRQRCDVALSILIGVFLSLAVSAQILAHGKLGDDFELVLTLIYVVVISLVQLPHCLLKLTGCFPSPVISVKDHFSVEEVMKHRCSDEFTTELYFSRSGEPQDDRALLWLFAAQIPFGSMDCSI